MHINGAYTSSYLIYYGKTVAYFDKKKPYKKGFQPRGKNRHLNCSHKPQFPSPFGGKKANLLNLSWTTPKKRATPIKPGLKRSALDSTKNTPSAEKSAKKIERLGKTSVTSSNPRGRAALSHPYVNCGDYIPTGSIAGVSPSARALPVFFFVEMARIAVYKHNERLWQSSFYIWGKTMPALLPTSYEINLKDLK